MDFLVWCSSMPFFYVLECFHVKSSVLYDLLLSSFLIKVLFRISWISFQNLISQKTCRVETQSFFRVEFYTYCDFNFKRVICFLRLICFLKSWMFNTLVDWTWHVITESMWCWCKWILIFKPFFPVFRKNMNTDAFQTNCYSFLSSKEIMIEPLLIVKYFI